MPVMEISIKWNVCRICLAEEQQHHAKYILIDSKMAKQIYDIAGVQMNKSDNLPDKICRKCLILLKYACHFSQTCRSSDEYLQSVIQKTKSATSMLKMDQRRSHSVEFLEDMFKEDVELISENGGEAVQHSTMDDKLRNPVVVDEKIEDGGGDEEICPTQLTRATSKATKVFNIQKCQRTQYEKRTTKFLAMKENDKIVGAISNKLNKINRVVKTSEQEFLYDDHEEYELGEFDDSKPNDKQDTLRACKTYSECSMDMAYINDDEQKQADDLDGTNDPSECSLNNENSNVIETDKMPNLKKNMENEKILPNSDNEQEQETDELFYIIEEPSIKEEESMIQQNLDVEDEVEVEGNVDTETDSTMQLIDDLTEANGCDGEEEPVYESSETNKSVVQLEEYLIDESDTGSVGHQETESTDELNMKQPSTTTIKIRDREQRGSPMIRRKGNISYMFSCDVCGNHFTNRSLRNYHMRIHRKEKDFECELCFKRFTAACNLTAHMRIHTGEKPYECQYCFRRFTDRSTHVKHERVHTNEKPFQCNTCGKSFALSTTLRTHEKVHTNEKPFKCEPCNKSFKLPHQLKSHLLTNQHKNILMASELRNPDYEKCI